MPLDIDASKNKVQKASDATSDIVDRVLGVPRPTGIRVQLAGGQRDLFRPGEDNESDLTASRGIRTQRGLETLSSNS